MTLPVKGMVKYTFEGPKIWSRRNLNDATLSQFESYRPSRCETSLRSQTLPRRCCRCTLLPRNLCNCSMRKVSCGTLGLQRREEHQFLPVGTELRKRRLHDLLYRVIVPVARSHETREQGNINKNARAQYLFFMRQRVARQRDIVIRTRTTCRINTKLIDTGARRQEHTASPRMCQLKENSREKSQIATEKKFQSICSLRWKNSRSFCFLHPTKKKSWNLVVMDKFLFLC